MCWNCRCKRKLQRCHIVPDSKGGEDKHSNFILLCSECHRNSPHIGDSEIMWDWIKSNSVPLYDTYWQIKTTKKYEISMDEELDKRNIKSISEIEPIMKKIICNTGHHFGLNHLNTASVAGAFRLTMRIYDEQRTCKEK